MKGPIKRTEEAIDSAATGIQDALDRVEGAAIMATLALAAVALVAVSALILAASMTERR